MSCNGCRVLRKGCSESCILRPCLQWIDSPESQSHATVFVAKFFGRAGLMSFISAVPESQRPALFQSLLFEACGRTVNPVNGAVGLLWMGNWHVCQAAVETVLRGGTLRPLTEIVPGPALLESEEASEVRDPYGRQRATKRKVPPGSFVGEGPAQFQSCDLGLSLMPGLPPEKRRPATPSMNSEGSVTTSAESGDRMDGQERRLLNLFV